MKLLSTYNLFIKCKNLTFRTMKINKPKHKNHNKIIHKHNNNKSNSQFKTSKCAEVVSSIRKLNWCLDGVRPRLMCLTMFSSLAQTVGQSVGVPAS